MKLENIGFYTLLDKRAKEAGIYSNMKRGEILITNKCNFNCSYCRGMRKDCSGEMSLNQVKFIIDVWAKDNLENIRFSGGEPTLHPYLKEIIKCAKEKKIKRIAVSTNGSSDLSFYKELIKLGVNDYSISLDACCSSGAEKMAGTKGIWKKIENNIKELSKLTYVTVGIVFTPDNMNQSKEIIEYAHKLGVADIRIISSAQYNKAINGLENIDNELRKKHPILDYRLNNFNNKRNVRGLAESDYCYCPLVFDDMAIAGKWHFPCIIYLREKGNPIGEINPEMRKKRYGWGWQHNVFEDEICRKNCLDVCRDYNNKWGNYHNQN